MSLKNNKLASINKLALILVTGIIFLILSISLIFPGICHDIQNAMTGLASIGTFQVSLTLIHAVIEADDRIQLDDVIVGGTNISILMPITYYDNITMNLSLGIPTGFECGYDWYVNESGDIKTVTINSTTLRWTANKAIKNTSLYFEVPPPAITSEVVYTGDAYYEKNIVINSCCPLHNGWVEINVDPDYQGYTLYLIENNLLVNKTAEYHLQVLDNTATFYGFNLSSKTFRLMASNFTPAEREVQVLGSGDDGVILLMNYSHSKQFLVEPNHISIITQKKGSMELYLTIYNLGAEEKDFSIESTNLFIQNIASSIIVSPKNYLHIPLLIDTTNMAPGKYTDHIYVRHGGEEENVTISLEILEIPTPTQPPKSEEKLPETEKPALIEQSGEEPSAKSRTRLFLTLLLSFGLLLTTLVIFLHLRGKED